MCVGYAVLDSGSGEAVNGGLGYKDGYVQKEKRGPLNTGPLFSSVTRK